MPSTPSFAHALDCIENVDGWLSDDQALRLWTRARAVRPGGRIVEIGSFRGRSTIVLGLAAPEGVEVLAVDPHAGNDRGPQEIEGFVDEAERDHEVFLANLRAAGVEHKVTPVRAFSHEALDLIDGSVDLLFIDGAHRYAPALSDVREWGARVVDGGEMLIHDAFSSVGVTLALARACFASDEWRYVGRSRTLAEYRREPVARSGNLARQAAQLPWFARNVAIKGLIVARLGRFAHYLGHEEGGWPY